MGNQDLERVLAASRSFQELYGSVVEDKGYIVNVGTGKDGSDFCLGVLLRPGTEQEKSDAIFQELRDELPERHEGHLVKYEHLGEDWL